MEEVVVEEEVMVVVDSEEVVATAIMGVMRIRVEELGARALR